MTGRPPVRAGLTRAALLRGAVGLAAARLIPDALAQPRPEPAMPQPAAPAMLTRPIPSSGEPMPVVGLGTWQTFDAGRDSAAKAPLGEVLARFFARGGRVIDSSPMYGTAEAVTGELLAKSGTRPRAFLATKVWIQGRDPGIAQMRQSAERFRSDVIDLMQIHNLVDWQVHLPTLRRMKEQGRIRYLGITHYTTGSLPELARIIAREPLDFVQLGYSIGVREAEQRVLPLARERGVAVIVNQPFQEGALFRRVRGKPLPAWAAEIGAASWAQVFLKYLIGNPAVTAVIPATAKPDHMDDNLAAGFGPQPDERLRRVMAADWDRLG